MKAILQDKTKHILRLEKDEEVFAELIKYAQANNIAAAYFSAIGTCSAVELGFYNAFLKEYRRKPFLENLEIVSLSGNLGILSGQPVIHAHGVFSDNEFGTKGGHIFSVKVLATCEVYLDILNGTLTRTQDPVFNLNLLS